MSKCICEWCNGTQNISGKGYCRRHYDQMRKYGHILDERSRCDKNRIEEHGDCAVVIITDGDDNETGRVIISKEDIPMVMKHRWTLNGNGYARTFIKTKPLYLHRYLTGCPSGMEVDHINHDKSDNRRENLRVVTPAVNKRNNNGKCVVHITDRKLSKPYLARVIKEGKIALCKYFETEEEAVEAVRKARIEVAEL